jgi:hypothetical protein
MVGNLILPNAGSHRIIKGIGGLLGIRRPGLSAYYTIRIKGLKPLLFNMRASKVENMKSVPYFFILFN